MKLIKRLIDDYVSILGYTDFSDFQSTILNLKNKIIVFIGFLFGATFQEHFWQNSEQFAFMWILLFMDLTTGVLNAIFRKEFNSRRLPRFVGICFTYSIMLFLSYNLSKYNPFFFAWLPSTLYFMFCATLFLSIAENFNKLGWLDNALFNYISSKIKELFNKINK